MPYNEQYHQGMHSINDSIIDYVRPHASAYIY